MIKVNYKITRGFTLVEMAVVLIIVGLLLGGLIVPLSAQLDLRNAQETKQSLEIAKEALTGFALTQGYLPCPDSNNVPNGLEGSRSASTGACLVDEGVLPWQTLGIIGTDAWQRYFRYRVTPAFSNNGTGTGTRFSLSSSGNITIRGDTTSINLTTSAVAVIISHGNNGYGAMNTIQSSPENKMPNPSSADESINTDGDQIYMSHVSSAKNGGNEFDDVVTWISPTVLFNRMVSAGRLP